MKVVAIAGVNLRRWLRDRSNVFFVFIFPIALVLVLGVAFGGGFTPEVGVVHADDPGPLATQLLEGLESADGVALERYPGEAELVDAVERGQAQAGLVIPPDYDQRLTGGEDVEVGYITRPDGVGTTLSLAVQGVVARQAARVQAARAAAEASGVDVARALEVVAQAEGAVPELDVSTRRVGEQLFGEDVERFDIGASSQLVLFMFLTGLTASAALIQSRQLGVSRRMLSTPTATRTIVAGEGLGRFGVVLFQGVYILLATLVVFGVEWGDPVAAIALLVVFSAVGAGAGMLMGAVFSNDQQAGGVGVIVGLALAALGGCMAPIEIFSPTMQRVAFLTPHAWALDGFSELVRRGGGLAEVVGNLGVLAAYAAVLIGLASWRLRVVLTRG